MKAIGRGGSRRAERVERGQSRAHQQLQLTMQAYPMRGAAIVTITARENCSACLLQQPHGAFCHRVRLGWAKPVGGPALAQVFQQVGADEWREPWIIRQRTSG